MPFIIDVTTCRTTNNIFATRIRPDLSTPITLPVSDISSRLKLSTRLDFDCPVPPLKKPFIPSRPPTRSPIALNISSRGAVTLPKDSKGLTSDKGFFCNFEVI